MCVNSISMAPTFLNLISNQNYNYEFIESELLCRFPKFMTNDKQLDLSELWKHNQKPLGHVHSDSANSTGTTFKRWRRTQSSSRSQERTVHKTQDDMSLLKFLAINALNLTIPASDILLKSRDNLHNLCNNHWFQLSGHPDSFAPAGPGTVWKKQAADPDNSEKVVYEQLSADLNLRDIIPQYFREVEYQGEKFIELEDLLHGFQDPNVIDIKMGTRTFLESEVSKIAARADLYQKMVAIDPCAPTKQEHHDKAVTKLRYMQFREQQSSSCKQGFRLEAMKRRGCLPITDLKKVKTREEVLTTLYNFTEGRKDVCSRLLNRLNEVRTKFEESEYFKNHEIVGSSIFMIYDDTRVGVWIIDFAKTNKVPEGIQITHRNPWIQGNHEEGFLYGLDNLISAFEELQALNSGFHHGNALPTHFSVIPVK